MKMYKFRLRFHWSLFPRVYSSISSDNRLAPSRGKPLSEPMVVSLLKHIYVTLPQWVNQLFPLSQKIPPAHLQTISRHFILQDVLDIHDHVTKQDMIQLQSARQLVTPVHKI